MLEPVGQLVQVAAADLEQLLGLALRAQRGEQAGALVELAHQLGRWQLRRIAAQATDDVGEAAQCVRRTRRQLLEQADRFRGARQWQVGVLRNLGQLRQRGRADAARRRLRSEETTSELQSLLLISTAVLCLKKK